jgi:hypothetical protein
MHFMHELYMACEGDLYTLDTTAARLTISNRQLLKHIGLGNLRFINAAETAFAFSPKERRAEIKGILKSLRRRGTFGRAAR